MHGTYELTFPRGLYTIVVAEVEERFAKHSAVFTHTDSSLTIKTELSFEQLLQLRTVQSVYRKLYFKVPRPKAILGDAHFRRLLDAIRLTLQTQTFKSFRIDAAGSNSSIFRRISSSIESAINLPFDAHNGELQLRFKPEDDDGWVVLIRQTPRPLSARQWRVADMPGALNACIAAAIIRLADLKQGVLCNITAGSGTILIEALLAFPDCTAIGLEIDPCALQLCRQNLAAAQCTPTLLHADARRVPLPAQSLDVIISDLPWGERVGDRQQQPDLYSAILNESSRLLKPGGQALFLTQHTEAFNYAMKGLKEFKLLNQFRIEQSGFWPTLIQLQLLE